MKIKKLFAIIFVVMMVFMGCGEPEHIHVFNKRKHDDAYLAVTPTCQRRAEYYFVCECGEMGEDTYIYGGVKVHSYTEEVVSDETLKFEANCSQAARYYYCCSMCGVMGNTLSFDYGEPNSTVHDFSYKNTNVAYIKSEPTATSPAEYFYTCARCGKKGDGWFSFGEPLRDYTEAEKVDYRPTSLTLTLYDTDTSTYGFTYNTAKRPLRPTLQIAEGTTLGDNYLEYDGTMYSYSGYDDGGDEIECYTVKVEVPLKKNTTYTYRAYDKYAKAEGKTVTFTTIDPSTTQSFKFAHISDTQVENGGANGGSYFGNVLNQIQKGDTDFIIHTGDIVQNGKSDGDWKAMLDANFKYLSTMPIMAISGNHDTESYGNAFAHYRHFNYKIPEQNTTNGVFYSFKYGNAKFIMLNTNDIPKARLGDAQFEWLKTELEDDDCTWKIVSVHIPLYSAGMWGSDPNRNSNSLGLREQLQKLFYDNEVDLVLQGHDHLVSKTYPINGEGKRDVLSPVRTIGDIEYNVSPNGVTYVMSGTGGNQTRSPFELNVPVQYKYALSSKNSSWAEFEINDNQLTVDVKYYDGSVKSYTKWGIIKE